uniref:Uncharacterized protein n=1 Tax=Anopheles dirus TaxID=7168 RepID=A0A182N7R1_9DIPT
MKPLETRSGLPGEPIAVRSALGWAVYGPCNDGARRRVIAVHLPLNQVRTDYELNEILRTQFALDDVSTFVGPLPEPIDVARAKAILRDSSFKTGDRYTTGLLWKADDLRFPDSKPMATKRLIALEKKLEKEPELKKEIQQQISNYIEKGYAHK